MDRIKFKLTKNYQQVITSLFAPVLTSPHTKMPHGYLRIEPRTALQNNSSDFRPTWLWDNKYVIIIDK